MGVDRERKVKSLEAKAMIKLVKYVVAAFSNQVHNHYFG